MADPLDDAGLGAALDRVRAAAGDYLGSLGDRPVQDVPALDLLPELDGALPDTGPGADAVIERLLRVGTAAATASSGPRFFHFVTGGVTPAALAADWTASLLDQNAFSRVSSPLAHEIETTAIGWLRDLFGLPASWGGALVASATFANFTSLGCATQWWGEKHGADVARDGLAGLPRMPVLSGGYVHASARKALQMLGHGSRTVEVYAADAVGRADLPAMRRRLEELDGAPAVLIANAGEVNAGDFDPIAELAELAEAHGAWLHVDGAFGLFAALSPRTSHLVHGIERAERKRFCLDKTAGTAGIGVRHAGRALPAGARRSGRGLRPTGTGVVAPGPVDADLGVARRLRPGRLPVHGRAPPGSCAASRAEGRRGARAGTPGRRAAVHSLFPGRRGRRLQP
jgi:hypothetical protein